MGILGVYVITGASRGLGLELTKQAGLFNVTLISKVLYVQNSASTSVKRARGDGQAHCLSAKARRI